MWSPSFQGCCLASANGLKEPANDEAVLALLASAYRQQVGGRGPEGAADPLAGGWSAAVWGIEAPTNILRNKQGTNCLRRHWACKRDERCDPVRKGVRALSGLTVCRNTTRFYLTLEVTGSHNYQLVWTRVGVTSWVIGSPL